MLSSLASLVVVDARFQRRPPVVSFFKPTAKSEARRVILLRVPLWSTPRRTPGGLLAPLRLRLIGRWRNRETSTLITAGATLSLGAQALLTY